MIDFKALKWNRLEHDDITRARVYWLEGYRCLTNPSGHGIELFADLRPYDPVFPSRKHTVYTVKVCCGAYGETAEQVELPRGTKLSGAKEAAIALATEAQANGHAFS